MQRLTLHLSPTMQGYLTYSLELRTDTRYLRPDVRAVDLKDSTEDFTARLGYRYVLPGSGDVPLEEAMQLLRAAGYDGFVAFEWEKRWHPELEAPEIAFATFIDFVQGFRTKSRGVR